MQPQQEQQPQRDQEEHLIQSLQLVALITMKRFPDSYVHAFKKKKQAENERKKEMKYIKNLYKYIYI